MHELGIARDLFEVVIEKARENSLKKITKIKIVIGEASGAEAAYLRHSLVDHIIPGTIAESAQLELVTEKIMAKCAGCGEEIKPQNNAPAVFACPSCGSANIEAVSGADTYVENIEGE